MRNEKLIEAREQRGWTQEVVAEKIGVSRVAYARWEEQGVVPRLWAINQASEIFHMTAEQLGFRKFASRSTTNKSLMPTSLVQVPGMMNAGADADMFSIALSALVLVQQMHGCTLDELLFRTEQEMRELNIMAKEHPEKSISRRETLKFLITLPAALIGLNQLGSMVSLPAEEVLPAYVTAIPACWQLYFDGGLLEVAKVLPGHITQLTALAQQNLKHEEAVANLLSQTHQLGYLIALQEQNFKTAQTHAQLAFHYAEMANDPNLRVASLIRQGNLFYTLKRPLQTLQKYQEAVQYSSNASPLLQSQAHIGLAEAYARFSDKSSSAGDEALHHRELAREMLPVNPEQDPHYAYTHFNKFTITNFEGLMYLHLGQPIQAWETFAEVDKEVPASLVPQRVELINRKTATLLALDEMHATCDGLELAVPAAQRLGSELRYNEACEIYQQAHMKWPNEGRVRNLATLFQECEAI